MSTEEISGSEYEHHHHHHHHQHHHSGESGALKSKRMTLGDAYSVHKSGNVTKTTRVLPEGTLSVAVFSVIVTALILAPVIMLLLFRNKTLTEQVDSLRTELGNMITEAERQGIVTHQPSTARRVVMDVEPEVRKEVTVEELPVVSKEKADRIVDIEAVASAVGMTKEELEQLNESLGLFPDGMRREVGENGEVAFFADAFRTSLGNAYRNLALGQRHDAAGTFRMISGEMPQWPYGHFFLALANRDHSEMSKASFLFTTVRALNQQTKESELYGALAQLFLKNYVLAEKNISRLARAFAEGEDVHTGPIFVPKTVPIGIKKKLRELNGIGEIKEIEWL